MTVRFTHNPPNFLLGFLLAPMAGALGTMLAAFILGPLVLEQKDQQGLMVALPGWVATLAFLFAAAFTIVFGLLVLGYVRFTGRVPSWRAAIAAGLCTGFLPFILFTLAVFGGRDLPFPPDRDQVFFASMVLAASCSTSWAFWFLVFHVRASK